MKQIKILGVLAIALALGLTACGGSKSSKSESKSEVPSSVVPSSTTPAESSSTPAESSTTPAESSEEEHVHTFAEEWSTNATYHWHAATCGHNVKDQNEKHTLVEVAPADDNNVPDGGKKAKAASCSEEGVKVEICSVCGYRKESKISKLAHTFAKDNDGNDVVVWSQEADCTNGGIGQKECTVCHEKVDVTTEAKGHTYAKDADGNDVVVWSKEASCTEGGEGKKTCTVCGHEEPVTTSELGHTYKTDADGNIEFTWTLEPSCEKAGVGTKHCERCGLDIPATEDESKALNHDIEAVGGETAPTDGTAAVRLYRCKRCNQTYMGFLANEVTDESKTHVRFEPETVAEGQEQGARFLGRPIGNALALDSDGTSVNKQNEECVYCSTETGDFIEYAFNLNAEQAATLATCRCYVDAKAADYLNGKDFFACGSGDEYTRGFYIDGGDERFEKDATTGEFTMVQDHEKAAFDSNPGAEKVDADGNAVMVKQGKPIEDFRYVLYVDDQVVDFDDTENPTHGNNTNMQREEFEMPYTFHLKEGLNKIKLVMAGGYRSLLYKFIFRPYVAPTPITVNETAIEVREGKTAQITSEMTGLLYKSSNTSVCTVAADGTVTGVKAGTATITVSKEGNYKDAKVPVTVLEKEGMINLNLNENYVVDPNPGEGEEGTKGVDVYYSSYNQATRLRNFQKDGSITYTFKSEKAGLYNIQLTGSQSGNLAENVSVKVNGADVAISGELKGSTYSAQELVIGQVELPVADDNTITIKCLAEGSSLTINGIKLFPHEHAWELAAEQPEEGATDAAVVKYVCPSCGMVKYEIAAKTAQMQVAADSDWKTNPTTSSDGGFKLNNGKTATFTFALPKGFTGKMYQRAYMDNYNSSSQRGKKAFYETNSHCNIEVKVNDVAIDFSRYETTKFSDLLGEDVVGTNSKVCDVELGAVTLAAANTISYKRVETLNMIVTHFVFIGYEAA